MLKLVVGELDPGKHVFLDSDDLHDLSTLFATVRHKVKILTVLCSREILLSDWCLGEITTASLYGVLAVPVHFPDFVPADDVFINGMSLRALLTESGLSLPDVQNAVRSLMSLTSCRVPDVCSEQALRELAVAIGGVHSVAAFSIRVRNSKTRTGSHHTLVGHVIVADFVASEVVAAARIYQKLIRPFVVQDQLPLGSLPQLISLDVDVQAVDPDGVLVILCSSGCFANDSFLVSLMSLVACGMQRVVPVVCSDDFAFPTAAFYAAVEEKTAMLCRCAGVQEVPRMLLPFLESVFKKICSRLSTKSSMDVLRLEISRVYLRFRTDAALSGYTIDQDTLQHICQVVKNLKGQPVAVENSESSESMN